MTAGTESDGLAAALIQISGHAERIGGLDARETAHHQETTVRLREAAAEAASVRTRIDAIGATIARHAAIKAVRPVAGRVAVRAARAAKATATNSAARSDLRSPASSNATSVHGRKPRRSHRKSTPALRPRKRALNRSPARSR